MQEITNITDLSNGHEAIVEAVSKKKNTVTVSPSDLRRLSKLQARYEGALQVAQAAVNASNAMQQQIQGAVAELCQDLGLRVPNGSNADIDWVTGEITITPPPPEGHILGTPLP